MTNSISTLFEMLDYFSGKQVQIFWILQHLCALKIVRAVQPRGKQKMPVKERHPSL